MSDIHKKLKRNSLLRYIYYMERKLFINETIKLITTEALEEEDREFNVVTYDLEEAYLEDVVEDARASFLRRTESTVNKITAIFDFAKRKVRAKYKNFRRIHW